MTEKETLIKKEHYTFDDLYRIMDILRSPEGCPWDREQTHESIRMNLLEEAYEAFDAIVQNDQDGLCEELGDLLMQVVFHAQMSKEEGAFSIDDVYDEVCKKLIVRHPHVFSTVSVDGSDEVLKNWEEIKNQTKGMSTLADTLNGVAKSMPALMRAQKLAGRTEKAGIKIDAVMPDAKSEKERIGKRLFELAAEAKANGIDAEEALTDYNNLYISRA